MNTKMHLCAINRSDMETLEIVRKKHKVLVTPMRVGDLDKSKCSAKFLSHNFPDDYVVYVKCYADGTPDLRGNNNEYRIVVPDKED